VWIIHLSNVLKFWFGEKYGVQQHVVTRNKGELSLRLKNDARQEHIHWDDNRESFILIYYYYSFIMPMYVAHNSLRIVSPYFYVFQKRSKTSFL
jgi:hypothetical protein